MLVYSLDVSTTTRSNGIKLGLRQSSLLCRQGISTRRQISSWRGYGHQNSTAQPAAVTERSSHAAITGYLPNTSINQHDLTARHRRVLRHFHAALGVDDFMARVEIVLSGYGFIGDNSIAMTNLCRDEVTSVLKDKIEAVFGSSFNTNGLGGVLTCGVTGMKAGLSHSPTSSTGRERYVFFSFPHIAIDGEGHLGAIARPGRAGRSCACGALKKCLVEFQAEGYSTHCKVPGVHDPLDPEYSILKQRAGAFLEDEKHSRRAIIKARRLRYERADVGQLDLADLTSVAERTMTNDLEYLIEKAVDPKKHADYAVITGIQIHNWATDLNGNAPSLEFVAPTKVYVVVNGVKVHLDLGKVPSLSPRQLVILASASTEGQAGALNGSSGLGTKVAPGVANGSTLQEIPNSYLTRRLGGGVALSSQVNKSLGLDTAEAIHHGANNSWPGWQSTIRTNPGLTSDRDELAPTMDSVEDEPFEEPHPSFEYFFQPEAALMRHSPISDHSDGLPISNHQGSTTTPGGANGIRQVKQTSHGPRNEQDSAPGSQQESDKRIQTLSNALRTPSSLHAPAWWLGLLAPGTLSVPLPDLGDWL